MWKASCMDTNWLVWGTEGEKRPRAHSCRATSHTRPTFPHCLTCIYACFLSELDITQLIMTRKIIAAQMMKTLDLWPQEDLHPTSVVGRDNLLSNVCLPVLLCGLRKAWKETDFCSLDLSRERRYGHNSNCPIWARNGARGMSRAFLVTQGPGFGRSR